MGLRLRLPHHVLERSGTICAAVVILTMLGFALAEMIVPVARWLMR